MSTYSSPDDEITGCEDVIRKSDVLERIDALKPYHVELRESHALLAAFRNESEAQEYLQATGSGNLEIYEDDTDSAELFALQELLADFSGSDSSYMIHEDFLEEYAQEEASDIAGDDASYLFSYVDWETLADDMKADMKPVDFRHNTYWLASR